MVTDQVALYPPQLGHSVDIVPLYLRDKKLREVSENHHGRHSYVYPSAASSPEKLQPRVSSEPLQVNDMGTVNSVNYTREIMEHIGSKRLRRARLLEAFHESILKTHRERI